MNVKYVVVAFFGVQVCHLQEAQYGRLKPTANDKLSFTMFQSAVGFIIDVSYVQKR